MHRPAVATTIVGATSVEQLDADLIAAEVDLPSDARRSLTEASRPRTGSPYRLFPDPGR